MSAARGDVPDDRVRDESSVELGRIMRARRKALGLTIAQVSEASGLSSPFISQLERGHTRPSMRSLQLIASALRTTAMDLFDAGSDSSTGDRPRTVDHFRAAERRALRQSDEEPDVRVLPITRGHSQFQAFDWIDGPHEWEGPFVHRNDEVMYVLEGAVEVELDGVLHVVETGDSIIYSGGVEHRWRAVTARSRVLVIVGSEHLGSPSS